MSNLKTNYSSCLVYFYFHFHSPRQEDDVPSCHNLKMKYGNVESSNDFPIHLVEIGLSNGHGIEEDTSLHPSFI